MRYIREEKKPVFVERHVVIETEGERVCFNQMLKDSEELYAGINKEMWHFIRGMRSGK
jgi:hypothetical protein